MKKADLSVGMTVESKRGWTGTIVTLDGWTALRAMYMAKGEIITMDDGREVKVWGRRDPKSRNVVVAWDHNPERGEIEALGQLVPVGTRAIKDAENAAAVERRKREYERLRAADIALVDDVRRRLGTRADALLAQWRIGEGLSDNDRRLLYAVGDVLDFTGG